MEKSSGIGDRIMQIIYHYRLNKNAFSKKLQLPGNSIIVRIVNDPTRGISLDLMQKILTTFPEVDPRWLVMGEGKMLREKNSDSGVEPKTFIHYYHKVGGQLVDQLRITGYEDCDSAFDVVGDAMVSKFMHGDIVICHKIHDEQVTPGDSYFIVTKGASMIRYIKSKPSDGQYKIGAENSRYEDTLVSSSEIESLYKIRGVIRRES
jgi:phage repressor protein C with HTH and peptisase S24 domain